MEIKIYASLKLAYYTLFVSYPVVKQKNILEDSLNSIPSPSPSVKIQIMGGKVGLRCKGKTLLGFVNKKSLVTIPSNVWQIKCYQLLEGDVIESRLPFKIFSTLKVTQFKKRAFKNLNTHIKI